MRLVPVSLNAVIHHFICEVSFLHPAQLLCFAPHQPAKLLLELQCGLGKKYLSLCVRSIPVDRAVWV